MLVSGPIGMDKKYLKNYYEILKVLTLRRVPIDGNRGASASDVDPWLVHVDHEVRDALMFTPTVP
jgi:hypothetical protein